MQLLLSSRPPRTKTALLSEVQGIFLALHARFESTDRYNYLYETHYVSTHPKAQGGKAKAQSGPAPHIHLHQAEYFKVIEGTLGVVVDGQDVYLNPEDEERRVPPGSRHCFWPEKGGGRTGNMTVRIRVDPYPGGLDERFIRNIFSYFADCSRQGVEPSLFQIMLFLYAHDMVVAMPLPIPVLHVIHFIGAYVIGWWLLGYKETYLEYYDDKRTAGRHEVKKEL